MIPMRKYLTIILFFLSISVFCQESNKKEKCFVNSIEEVVNKELEEVRKYNKDNNYVFISYEYSYDTNLMHNLKGNEFIKDYDDYSSYLIINETAIILKVHIIITNKGVGVYIRRCTCTKKSDEELVFSYSPETHSQLYHIRINSN